MIKKLSNIISAFENSFTKSDGFTPCKSDLSVTINGLFFDSRDVAPGSLFFALPGTHVNGNEFIPAAVEKGANVIIFQGEFEKDLQVRIEDAVSKWGSKNAPVFCKVPDSRFAMAPVADAFYDHPSKKLIVIGVTGTEGKSSTVSFIWQLLRLCGKKAGFISTVQFSLGEEAVNNPQHQTTPEAPVIQESLYKMVENGCEYAVIESSSHGLSKKLNRTGNILFDCGVFMNVALEHLEFHKTFEQYRFDKANLFRSLDEHDHIKTINGKTTQVPAFGIVNLEDPSAQYFMSATGRTVYGFTSAGLAGKAGAKKNNFSLPPVPAGVPYVAAKNIVSKRDAMAFDIDCKNFSGEGEIIHVKTRLPGAFNAYNLMAAAVAVNGLTGLDIEQICSKMNELVPVAGRMTTIEKGQPFEVIVDYAHTPSSFETIFPPIRKRCEKRIFALFGSGGERDLQKRPLQGKIAAKFSDVIILTDEDPRGEDSFELLQMIAEGAKEEGKILGKDMFITPDRPRAIRQAFSMAKEGDIVLLLGKSHENSIIYKDRVMPYDEIREAASALSEMGFNG
ncbi:UDP-N-acetylmuramoyl-L-alanyl-D-glutamate--2,6-diaminopimelate ligase [Treponema parvum]|uniref:UDP-N-acetylmuramyl-tripeptide synthetase n=1 Tax=Treponema parvum TaxID=138851 RepID=A0A975EYH3_9SPIR|nr:UDP-N-acetylmuramoyl-L-alanyl-D-glutamate--2,6-diaminopimelate ligase [Treponema parvum]QTQ11132.1 UDP-N-acetylmuramoyl-L-alanyl-D-glutamate--2,6-diaminopimelate ligase [Treponema parvum]QTQ16927.1 UDP-N-acetylmuramoyl-L-alanyl-D-glutamate--2,6-diaminopimelate ligase [Treponema parvum]